MTGVNMVHVPYRGNAPALTDLIAGQVQVMFADTPSSIEHVKAGKLRALAVTTAERSQILPEVPTVSEFLPGFEASNWFGVAAPKNTPPEIIDKLNKEINAALAEPDIKARLARFGCGVACGLARRFRKIHRHRSREVEQGDPGRQHQGGIGFIVAPTFHNVRCAKCGPSAEPTRWSSKPAPMTVVGTFLPCQPRRAMSASLIGHSGQALSDYPPLQCRCRSRARASLRNRHQGPFHHGIRGRGGTIFRAALPSDERQVQADMRTHLIHRPRGTSFHRAVDLRFFSYLI